MKYSCATAGVWQTHKIEEIKWSKYWLFWILVVVFVLLRANVSRHCCCIHLYISIDLYFKFVYNIFIKIEIDYAVSIPWCANTNTFFRWQIRLFPYKFALVGLFHSHKSVKKIGIKVATSGELPFNCRIYRSASICLSSVHSTTCVH